MHAYEFGLGSTRSNVKSHQYLCRHGVGELLHAGPKIQPFKVGPGISIASDLLHDREIHENPFLHLRVTNLFTALYISVR